MSQNAMERLNQLTEALQNEGGKFDEVFGKADIFYGLVRNVYVDTMWNLMIMAARALVEQEDILQEDIVNIEKAYSSYKEFARESGRNDVQHSLFKEWLFNKIGVAVKEAPEDVTIIEGPEPQRTAIRKAFDTIKENEFTDGENELTLDKRVFEALDICELYPALSAVVCLRGEEGEAQLQKIKELEFQMLRDVAFKNEFAKIMRGEI